MRAETMQKTKYLVCIGVKQVAVVMAQPDKGLQAAPPTAKTC